MIRIEIQPNDAPEQDYILRVRDGNNGNVLLSSTSQGYANPGFAQELSRRLFPAIDQPFDNNGAAIEPVVMVTTFANGKTETEQLR